MDGFSPPLHPVCHGEAGIFCFGDLSYTCLSLDLPGGLPVRFWLSCNTDLKSHFLKPFLIISSLEFCFPELSSEQLCGYCVFLLLFTHHPCLFSWWANCFQCGPFPSPHLDPCLSQETSWTVGFIPSAFRLSVQILNYLIKLRREKTFHLCH